MTNPGGRLWVDPEGVTNVGDAYAEHVALYDEHLRQLRLLREQYDRSWGDDQMGARFSQKFLAGLTRLEAVVKGIKGTLDYTANGLRSGGVQYRKADDEAREAGHRLAVEFDEHSPQHIAFSTRAPTPSGEGNVLPFENATPMAMAYGVQRQGRLLGPRPESAGDLPPHDGDTPPSEGRVRFERAHMVPMGPSALVADPPPHDGDGPLPMGARRISPFTEYSENDTPHVDGVPLADGYRLRWFSEFPGGAIRLDLNLYESVSPVGDLSVTTSDGQMVAAGNSQPFVVKERADVDPMKPGYQPMYVDFASDGTLISPVPDLR